MAGGEALAHGGEQVAVVVEGQLRVEAAVEAAYHKSVGNSDPARAVLDQKTGKIVIMVPDTEERDDAGDLIVTLPDGSKVPEVDKTPENFGRIAANAAKQVIAQRIRGISDEGLYGEFKAKVEDIAATPGIGSKIASIIEEHLSTISSQKVNTETGEILGT